MINANMAAAQTLNRENAASIVIAEVFSFIRFLAILSNPASLRNLKRGRRAGKHP